MKFTDIFRRRERRNAANEAEGLGALLYAGSGYTNSKAMKLSAVYRCVDCISQAIAQLPLGIFRIDADGFKHEMREHPLAEILNTRPNARMSRYTLLSMWVQDLHLRGNGYGYILRKGARIEQIIYLQPSQVTVEAPTYVDMPVRYIVAGMKEPVPAEDMIHIINKTFDGVTGVSTLTFASQTLKLSHDSETHASNFFASGCGIGGIIKSATRLRDGQAAEIKKAWMDNFTSQTGGTNGVAVLDADVNFTPVTINPTDAQLLETRMFNVIDICRFFGVSPVKAFDLTKSSYSTVEATNISFLTDTVSPLLEKIELELERKLFAPGEKIDVRFDVSQLLRADKQSLANYFSTLFNIGAMKPNEIRREIDLPPIEGGDANFVQVNLQTLKAATAPKPDNLIEN